MSLNKEKLARIAAEQESSIPILRRNAADPKKDARGSATSVLADVVRQIGVASYVTSGSVAKFRAGLAESTELRSGLFDRFDRGEPVDGSYVSMLGYDGLLDAMAAGDDELAVAYASRMGGRKEAETEHDGPFETAFGYCLKSIVTGDSASTKEWVEKLAAACRGEHADFRGYATVLKGLLLEDQRLVDNGFAELLAGHKRLSKGDGLFAFTEDELLSVWGVALARRGVKLGMRIDIRDPLIPIDLIGATS